MAATKQMTSGRKRDKTLNHLEERFPGSKVSGRPCNPSLEIASLRSARDNGTNQFDTSNLAWMLDVNRRRLSVELEIASQNRLHILDNADDREQFSNLMQRSRTEEAVAKEIAAYRTFEITTDLLATPFALGAFQAVNLGPDELPMFMTPKARQFFNVRYIGQDGGARQDQWRTTKSATFAEMFLLSTDKIEYPLMDFYEGDVNEYNTITQQLRYDMEMKIDGLALESLDNNITATGLKAEMNIHPLIDQANMPDGNYLDLTDVPTYGVANTLTIARIKAILNQMALWGFGFDPDGPITIATMIMSPLNARDSWDYIDLVSGWDTSGETWGGKHVDNPLSTVPTATREAVWSNGGLITNAWGHSWVNQFNPRITRGRLYVLTNQPVGWYFTKSNWDRTIDWRDQPDNVEQNYGQVVMQRALNFYQPSLWRYRYLVVDF